MLRITRNIIQNLDKTDEQFDIEVIDENGSIVIPTETDLRECRTIQILDIIKENFGAEVNDLGMNLQTLFDPENFNEKTDPEIELCGKVMSYQDFMFLWNED